MYATMQITTHKYGHGKLRNKKLIKRRNDVTQGWQALSIALEKGRDKKGEKTNYYYTGDSSLVTQPSTKPAEQGLNFVERAKHVPCGIVTLRRTRFLKLLRCKKASKREIISETG